jgi:hypothetical protein
MTPPMTPRRPLADYRVLGWARHHHATTMVMAMLFIAEHRAVHQPKNELLSARSSSSNSLLKPLRCSI